jgi:molecular chaperone HtpG
VVRKIRNTITGKVLNTLADMMRDEPDKYKEFYCAFGRILKEGLHNDWENTEKLKNLLMFPSAKTGAGCMTSLRQYVEAMPQKQEAVYYLIAEDEKTARLSPHIETLAECGFDVLFFVDPVDQWIAHSLDDYEGKKFVAVDKGELQLGDEQERQKRSERLQATQESYKSLLEFIGEALKDDVKEVRFSSRLKESSCCLVADENALSPGMERMMRAMNQEVPAQLRIFEINGEHALVKKMKAMFDADPADRKLAAYVELLFGQALLSEGAAPKNPQSFVRLVTELMVD